MPLTTDYLRQQLEALQPYQRLVVAFSGGLDSSVLLHLVSALEIDHVKATLAVYINHGLQADSSLWATHCADVCLRLKIPYQCIDVSVASGGGRSLEADAREARYAALKKVMNSGDLLLTAHHQDDQAETILLQLLRGSGVDGLAGMPPVKPLGEGLQVRPLLSVSRTDLESYASQVGLSWVEDKSNQETDFDRNYLRHQVMPLLKERWPGCAKTLSRSASHCAEAQTLLVNWSNDKLSDVGSALPAQLLLESTEAESKVLLRAWIKRTGFRVPSTRVLNEIITQLTLSGGDRNPTISWQGAEVRRYRDQLYIMPPLKYPDPDQSLFWNIQDQLQLPCSLGTLALISGTDPSTSSAIDRKKLEGRVLTVRFSAEGVEYQRDEETYHRRLKHYFQEQGIPVWQRRRLPLLFAGDQLVAVADMLINAPFRATESESACSLAWKRSAG